MWASLLWTQSVIMALALPSASLFVGAVIGFPMWVASGLSAMQLLRDFCLAVGFAILRSRELRNRHLVRGPGLIAKYSYGVQPTHVLALGALDGRVLGPEIVQWVATMIFLPELAYVCYHGIENHRVGVCRHSQRGEQCSVAGAEAL